MSRADDAQNGNSMPGLTAPSVAYAVLMPAVMVASLLPLVTPHPSWPAYQVTKDATTFGGIISGSTGALIGGFASAGTGVLSAADRIRLRTEIARKGLPSQHTDAHLRAGVMLNMRTIPLHPMPQGIFAPGYRYALVNGRIVIVAPSVSRIAEIIE